MKLKTTKQTVVKTFDANVYEVPLPFLLEYGSINVGYDENPDDDDAPYIDLTAAVEPHCDTLVKITVDGKEVDMSKVVFHIAESTEGY